VDRREGAGKIVFAFGEDDIVEGWLAGRGMPISFHASEE
jgi:hypothetical protein